MREPRSYHDGAEVRRALSRISTEDAVRVMQLARNWVRRAPRRSAEDLINEAFTRVLEGFRRWPVDLPLPSFLSGVMRSIVSDWAMDDQRQPLIEEEDVPAEPEAEDERDLTDMFDRMVDHLEDDPPARQLLLHMWSGAKRAEAAAAMGLSEVEYGTVRRRMSRKLLKAFGPEWSGDDGTD
jgi:RNA polymerase sigma factor (sigma-70 family)